MDLMEWILFLLQSINHPFHMDVRKCDILTISGKFRTRRTEKKNIAQGHTINEINFIIFIQNACNLLGLT